MMMLKFLVIFLAVVWFVGLVIRATLGRFLRKQTEAYQRAAREAQRQARARGRKEGDVTVESSPTAATKKVNRSVGEYVEFEEIKESDG